MEIAGFKLFEPFTLSPNDIVSLERDLISATSLSRFLPPYLLKEDDIKTGRLSPLLLFDFFFFQIFLIDIARQRSASYTPFPPSPSSRNEIGSPKRTKSCATERIPDAHSSHTRHSGVLGKPRMELAMDRGGGRQRYSSRIKLGRYGCAL